MTTPAKIVFLNGPPRSGKDTIAKNLKCVTHIDWFAREVKEGTHRAFGLTLEHCSDPVPFDHYEQYKDTPLPEFRGATPRRAYIHYSEGFMKPMFGDRVFGAILAERLNDLPDDCIVAIPDSGFTREAWEIMDVFGEGNCALVRVHRADRDFSNDSRGLIELPCDTLDVYNITGQLRDTVSGVESWLRGVFGLEETG